MQSRNPTQVYSTQRATEQWLYRGDLSRYRELLRELVVVLDELFLEVASERCEELAAPDFLDDEATLLYERLLHGLTVLHHPYRMSSADVWGSVREDQVLALRLLQPAAMPATLLTPHLRRTLVELTHHFWLAGFTIGEAYRALRRPKSNVKRWVTALERSGHLRKQSGSRNRGYRYEIVRWAYEK